MGVVVLDCLFFPWCGAYYFCCLFNVPCASLGFVISEIVGGVDAGCSCLIRFGLVDFAVIVGFGRGFVFFVVCGYGSVCGFGFCNGLVITSLLLGFRLCGFGFVLWCLWWWLV